MGEQVQHLQLSVKVPGQPMAQGLGQAITWEHQFDAAGVVRAGLLAGVVEAEHRLGRAEGREALHLHHIRRLVMLQIIVALQWPTDQSSRSYWDREQGIACQSLHSRERQCLQKQWFKAADGMERE